MNLSPGSKIGDYEILSPLGAGGMGRVYKVRNELSDRLEAMKILLPDLEGQVDLANRFLREIKVQANLDHPNIAKLYTATRIENRLLMFMEYVEGVTLDERLKQGPVPIADAIDYILQVLGALDYAHQRGVVHRDIKPANMMLMPDGRVKLLDFGIAKAAADNRLTMTGTTLGSLYYMAPEQIQGGAVDMRSDLYSVGVSLYETVTGSKPFDGESQFAIMSAHLARDPVPPIQINSTLPPAVSEIILMSLSKEPPNRFQTAGAFLNALRNVKLPGRAERPLPFDAPPVRAGFHTQDTAPLTAPIPAARPALPIQPQPPAATVIESSTAPFKDSVAGVTVPVLQPVPPPQPPPSPQAASPPQPPPPPQTAPPPPPDFHLIQPTVEPKKSGPKRMIWVALGGIAAALAIVAFIQFGPRMKTSAKESSFPVQSMPQPAPPVPVEHSVTPPATPPDQPPATTTQTLPPLPGKAPATTEAKKPKTERAQVRQPSVQQQPPVQQPLVQQQPVQQEPQQQAPPQPTQPQPANANSVLSNLANSNRVDIEQLSEQYTKMAARANALKAAMDNMRAAQAQQGVGMRSDWVESYNLVVTYMQQAKQALSTEDPPTARAAMQKAERQLGALEKAMGR